MSVWMVETLLATTLLMAVVMMLRRPVARFLGAGAAYWLWALPVARMVLPALPQEVMQESPLHVAVDQAGLPDLLAPAADMPVQAVSAAPGAMSLPWLELAVGLWMGGALLFLLVQAIGYARFRRLILRDSTALAREGRLHVIASPRASGPLAFGVFRPYIVLPADFALRFDAQEQDMAIAHERAHHERGDLAANMVALFLLGLHWCNPVAWIAYRAYRADQEQACDARVLALYGQENAHAYGRAILKAAGGRQFAAACHLNRLSTLKGRLSMLSSHDASLRRISWGMAAVGLVTLAGLALTASGSRAAQQVAAITDQVQDMRLARLANLISEPAIASTLPLPAVADIPEAPQAPAAPATPVAAAVDRVDDAAVPPAPPAPAAPPSIAVMPVPPVPPVPAVPAVPQVRTEKNRIVVIHPDGRRDVHRIPSQAEIRRMVPDIDIADGCEGDSQVSRSETVDRDGRRHIRMRICKRMIEDQARAGAIQGLRVARETIARTAALSDETRAQVLAELDREIADQHARRD